MIYKQIGLEIDELRRTFYVFEYDVELPSGLEDFNKTCYLKPEYTPEYSEQDIIKTKIMLEIQQLIDRGYKQLKREN